MKHWRTELRELKDDIHKNGILGEGAKQMITESEIIRLQAENDQLRERIRVLENGLDAVLDILTSRKLADALYVPGRLTVPSNPPHTDTDS